MIEALPFSELLLGRVNISKQFELLYESLVLAYIHHDSRAMASLSQHQDSLRLTNLLDERRRIRPKLGDWLDVLLEVNSSQEGHSTVLLGVLPRGPQSLSFPRSSVMS